MRQEKEDFTQELEHTKAEEAHEPEAGCSCVPKNEGTANIFNAVQTLGLALSDEAKKAQLLGQEIADDSAIQRARAGNIEAE